MSKYSKVADCCSCGGVAIATVGDCLAVFSKAGKAGSSVPAYPFNVKSLRTALASDSRVLWARFRHRLSHCSHGFRESCHSCVHRSTRRLLTNFHHLCSELIKLTSQHLNFLSRCHRHSTSQYCNTRNKSVPRFQDNLLRYHARMGNHAKRVNVRCALWMMRANFSQSDLGPRRSVYENHVSVKSTVTGCDVIQCATTLQGFNKQDVSNLIASPLSMPGTPLYPAVRPYLCKIFCRKYTIVARLPLSNSSFCWIVGVCCVLLAVAFHGLPTHRFKKCKSQALSPSRRLTQCLHCTCWRQQQEFIGAVKLAVKNSSHPPHVQLGSILRMVWSLHTSPSGTTSPV